MSKDRILEIPYKRFSLKSFVVSFLKKLICRHDWKILFEYKHKSSAERYGDLTGKVPVVRNYFQLEEMMACTIERHFVCKKCGKLEHYSLKI